MKNIVLVILLFISNISLASDKLDWSIQSFRADDQQMYFAVNFKNDPGWYLYWKNPGDSGSAPEIKFYLNDVLLEMEETNWPSPTRKVLGPHLWTYALPGEYTLFYKIPGLVQDKIYDREIVVDLGWLSCGNICIPGSAMLKGHYIHDNFTPNGPSSFTLDKELLNKRLASLPKKATFPKELDILVGLDKPKNQVYFYYNIPFPIDVDMSTRNLLTPISNGILDFGHETLYRDKSGTLYGKLAAMPVSDFITTHGKLKKSFNVKFLFLDPSDSKEKVIEKSFSMINLQLPARMNDFHRILKPITPKKSQIEKQVVAKPVNTGKTLWYYLLLAFIGGLILNIMPCVLPVISFKLFGLIKLKNSTHKEIFKHNVFYTLGVLISFALLGGAVVALKMAGESIGWGFQLQSPTFVIFVVVALFVFALNLLGMFEFSTPGGKLLGNVGVNEGLAGSFLSGVLATILSTPCSAPFLGTALTFAFTSSVVMIMSIFLMIGLGLAFPIMLTGVFPKLISIFPKPGNWMNHFKKVMGIILIVTILWLESVYFSLTGLKDGVLYLNIILLSCVVIIYIHNKILKNRHILILLSAIVLLCTYTLSTVKPKEIQSHSMSIGTEELRWEKWSEENMSKWVGKKDIFIEFSADWCITCKTFNKIVIDTDAFKELVQNHDLHLMMGDWTRRDEKISKWLHRNGHVGVPAYFIQKKSGELIPLGETISIDKIKSSL